MISITKEVEARLLPRSGEYRFDPITGQWFKMSETTVIDGTLSWLKNILGLDI